MADPIDVLAGDNRPAPIDGRRCEFCQCALSAKGEVLEMSQKARELRNLQDDLAREQAAHVATKNALSAAEQRIAELEKTAAPPATVKAGRFGTFK
jgi:hypothetical protein